MYNDFASPRNTPREEIEEVEEEEEEYEYTTEYTYYAEEEEGSGAK